MKNKVCTVCKDAGKLSFAEGDSDLIYQKHGKAQSIRLCYYHSVEFFKIGQLKFVFKYDISILDDVYAKKNGGLSDYFNYGGLK